MFVAFIAAVFLSAAPKPTTYLDKTAKEWAAELEKGTGNAEEQLAIIARFKSEAAPYAPVVVRYLKVSKLSGEAAKALAAMGPAGLSVLEKAVLDPQVPLSDVLSALDTFEGAVDRALPQLGQRLDAIAGDEDLTDVLQVIDSHKLPAALLKWGRSSALRTLKLMRLIRTMQDAAVDDALAEFIASTDIAVAEGAVGAFKTRLGRGLSPKRAISLLEDKNEKVRARVVEVLTSSMQSIDHREWLAARAKAENDSSAEVRLALATFSECRDDTLTITFCRDTDPRVRKAASDCRRMSGEPGCDNTKQPGK